MVDVKQVFQAEDGTIFDTRAGVIDYARRPKIKAALMAHTKGNEQLSDWLIEHRDDIEGAYDTGTIKRVTNSEKNKLQKALEAVVEAHKNDSKFAFVTENVEAIRDSFRWPSVKRLKPEEKTAAVVEALTTLADGNTDLANYVASNEEAITAAYSAGVEKRAVNPKASEALALYQAKKKAEKEAKAADAAAEAERSVDTNAE